MDRYEELVEEKDGGPEEELDDVNKPLDVGDEVGFPQSLYVPELVT